MNTIMYVRRLLSATLIAGTALAQAQVVSNGSFETPPLASGTFQSAPTTAFWTFSGSAGISSSGSAVTTGSPEIPDGKQVAYLQGTSSIQETVTLVPNSVLTFNATQRIFNGNIQNVQVFVNGVAQTFSMGSPGGLSNVISASPPSNYYSSYAVALSSVTTTGSYTVKIATTNPADATVLLDTLAISTPASHYYGLWDGALLTGRWRSDQETSNNVPQIGACPLGGCTGFSYPASYPASNWTHSSNYVAGSPHWSLTWNDEPSGLINGQLPCASGPPDQSIPVQAPGVAGGDFSINAVTTSSDPAIGNYNVASIIYSSVGGTAASSGCIPYLGISQDYRHGNGKPIAIADSAGTYRPHLKFRETVFQTDANSLICVRLGFQIDGWSDKIERQLLIDLVCRGLNPPTEMNLNSTWSWPIKNSMLYPGAYISIWDATYVNSVCNMNIPSLSLTNTYLASNKSPSSIGTYDIDLYALFSCVASHGGWGGGASQRLPNPLVVTHVNWALETQDSTTKPPGSWIAVWNPLVQ